MPTHSETRLLTEREAADVLHVSRRWLQDLRLRGEGVPHIKLTPRLIRYDRAALLAWAEQRAGDAADRFAEAR